MQWRVNKSESEADCCCRHTSALHYGHCGHCVSEHKETSLHIYRRTTHVCPIKDSDIFTISTNPDTKITPPEVPGFSDANTTRGNKHYKHAMKRQNMATARTVQLADTAESGTNQLHARDIICSSAQSVLAQRKRRPALVLRARRTPSRGACSTVSENPRP
jgi:hypothetical protein